MPFFNRRHHCHLLGLLPPGVRSHIMQNGNAAKTPANQQTIDHLANVPEDMHLDQPVTMSNGQLRSIGQTNLLEEQPIQTPSVYS